LRISTESVRRLGDEPSHRESSVFDGRAVRLRGARGETLGLQVRLPESTADDVRLELPDAGAATAAFAVRFLVVEEPSSSMYGPSAGSGSYPDVLVPAGKVVRAEPSAYFDIAIPKNAKPGRYDGELFAGARVIPVVLDVSTARIDLERNPLVWVFYAPREIAREHGLPDGDGSALIDKEEEYDRFFRAHGAYLASDLPPERFVARRRFVHDVSYWPVKVDTRSDETIRRDVRSWLELFAGSDVIPFAIPIDEPRSLSDKARVRHIADVMGSAGGRRPLLLRAVTDAAHPVYGDAMDVFISPNNIPQASAARSSTGERFWTYNGRPPQAGSMVLDADGGLRTWGWIAERYGIELWYAWEGLYFSDRYNGGGPTDLMRRPITFDERRRGGSDWGNGDGVLAYPGPLPSLRLKSLRRGLQDRLLLRALAACGHARLAEEVARRIVPRALAEAEKTSSWPDTDADWERARGELLDAIEERCHADA
jgi:hypothetical protein